MAEPSATAPVIPADQVRVAEGRFLVPASPVSPAPAEEIIRAALSRHAGDDLNRTTRLLGMDDLLMELDRRGMLADNGGLKLAVAAFSVSRRIALGQDH